jgi:hypothetical protein
MIAPFWPAFSGLLQSHLLNLLNNGELRYGVLKGFTVISLIVEKSGKSFE